MLISVKGFVNAIQDFHYRQSSYYFSQKDKFHDPRIINLLDYLGKLEQENGHKALICEKTLETNTFGRKIDVEDSQALFILNDHNLESVNNQGCTYNEILAYAIQSDVMLKNICAKLSASSDYPLLKNLFSSFCTAEERDINNTLSYNNMFTKPGKRS